MDDHQTTNARFLADRGAAGWCCCRNRADPWLADMLQKQSDAILRTRAGGQNCNKPRPPAVAVAACEELHETRDQHIHFVGVGGSGMSGIAEVLHNLGYTISDPDLADSATTMAAAGHATYVGTTPPRNGPDAVVTSTAVKADNPRSDRRGRELHLPVVPRALMLAELMRLKQGIAIAGTTARPPPPAWWPACWPRRAGPDLRHRRAPEQRGANAAWVRATTSWSRPTSRMRRSSTCCR